MSLSIIDSVLDFDFVVLHLSFQIEFSFQHSFEQGYVFLFYFLSQPCDTALSSLILLYKA
jgi:hypothetical protein